MQRVGDEEGIAPLLFPFTRKGLAEELVLRLLQLFGAMVPGMVDTSQEAILRQLSTPVDAFPVFSPTYAGLSTFLYNFLLLLTTANGLDVGRIIATYVQTYAFLNHPDKAILLCSIIQVCEVRVSFERQLG